MTPTTRQQSRTLKSKQQSEGKSLAHTYDLALDNHKEARPFFSIIVSSIAWLLSKDRMSITQVLACIQYLYTITRETSLLRSLPQRAIILIPLSYKMISAILPAMGFTWLWWYMGQGYIPFVDRVLL